MMIQKKRDIATMCKNSQYTGLYNPTNISYKEFTAMHLEIQGMYKTLKELDEPYNPADECVEDQEDTTSKDLKLLHTTVEHF